jgi:hypothetical protein
MEFIKISLTILFYFLQSIKIVFSILFWDIVINFNFKKRVFVRFYLLEFQNFALPFPIKGESQP